MGIIQQNDILSAAENKVEGQLTPQNKADYGRIVVAGMKSALQGGPNGILASLRNSKDPVDDAAKGAVGLCVLMFKESRGTMPIKAMVPAGMTLMLNALRFAQDLGLIKVTQQTVVQATHTYVNTLFQVLHITPQMMQVAAHRVQAITQDPASMAKINLAAGLVRNPNAPTPTPLPGANEPQEDEGNAPKPKPLKMSRNKGH